MRTVIKRTLESVFACIAVIGLVSGLAEAINLTEICRTEECVHTASYVLKNMNATINPCDDFYQFACGKYFDGVPVPDDKKWVNPLAEISDRVREQLKDIITEDRRETDPKYYRLPSDLYKACMNTSLIETLGPTPIQEIAEGLGGWPVIVGDCWDSDNSWTWQKAAKNFSLLGFGINYVVGLAIDVNSRNNTNRIINLDQPSLGLSQVYLINGFNESFVSAYYNYMVDTAELFGAKRETAEKDLMESLIFEINLAHISWSVQARRNASALHNLYSIKQLQELYPYMRWLDFINSFLPDGLSVGEDEIINISVPSFYKNLGELLNKTEKRSIANLMMWRMYEYALDHLSEKFRKRKMQFTTALTGKQNSGARWKECVYIVSQRLSAAVGSQYLQKHFELKTKTAAEEMVAQIRKAFGGILDNATWMDGTTKQNAKAKLELIIPQVGYLDELLNDTILENYYQSLNNSDPGNYLKSSLMINVFKQDYSFNRLRLQKPRPDWTTFDKPAMVNAFYKRSENTINFPAGILQGFLFNRERPQYMNYGGIGSFMGHEITHGFDDRGSLFDGYGNLLNWWHNDTREAYLEKTKCIIKQYDNYTDKETGLNLNGNITQGENIADNGGIKQSYLAYTEWLRNNGEELKLPGLHNYTSRQMFWIAAAQQDCAKHRIKTLKSIIKTSVHSPSEFRVLGSLSNRKQFSKDFRCDIGTRMNPTKKCEVW